MNVFKNLLDQAVTSALRRININSDDEGAGGSGNISSSNSPHGPTCPTGDDCICHNPEHLSDWHAQEIQQFQQLCLGNSCSWIIPLGGNAFLCSCTSEDVPLLNSGNQLTPEGLVNWTDSQTKVSLFVHCDQPGTHLVALRLQVPGRNSSRIRVSVRACDKQQCGAPQISDISLEGSKHDKTYQVFPCGTFRISNVGYFKIDLMGLQKSGPVFANVSHAVLIPIGDVSSRGKRSVPQSPSESPQFLGKKCVKFVSDPNDFYFGRRGPSVHLNYVVPQYYDGQGGEARKIEYFYNELMVPTGQDVVGAYFCAIGFSGGYFGIQVNSATERRILFSVWSEYDTDNPQEIPKDFKVAMIKKGSSDVQTGEFGNEGSGGQSYLRYYWKSSRVYKFLLRAKPMNEDNTMYSAWFCESTGDERNDEWRLVASFRKPKVSTHLQGLYSFSENFIPEMGHVERYCIFGNQWAWDTGRGEWVEVTKVKFTADATAMKGDRKDIAAGLMEGEGGFYLRNCGFFSDSVEPGKEFCRRECRSPPKIDFSSLS